MDQSRLDDLTRFVARRTGRRSLVAGALGSLLATLAPGLGTTDTAAKPGAKRSPCRKPKRRCGKQCVSVANNRQHCGKCNRRCKPGHTCRGGKCTPPPCGKGGPCLVFVTSTEHSGEMGGLAGADAICTRAAREANVAGTFKAWLSSQSGSPYSRFARNPGPYVLVNGTRVANNWADLIDGNLLAPINVTETNVSLNAAVVWTGTDPQGKWEGLDCLAWTDRTTDRSAFTGYTLRWDARWTYDFTAQCHMFQRLYCFQQS